MRNHIAIRITFVAPIGIIAAAMVISRRLCKIATGTTVTSTRRDKRRAIIIDLIIGLAPPLAQFIICKTIFPYSALSSCC